MSRVLLSVEAESDLELLPIRLLERFEDDILMRLEAGDPWRVRETISGAKPLHQPEAGVFRIQTGDWRIKFRPVGDSFFVMEVKHRSVVYTKKRSQRRKG